MRLKKITDEDLQDLRMCSAALSTIPGVGFVASTRTLNDLMINGSAFISVDIDAGTTRIIWEMMSMSRDDPRSAYKEVMEADERHLIIKLFKAGGLFSTFFFANAAISYRAKDGKPWSVEFGSVASKRISGVIDGLRKLLMSQRAISGTTGEAIARLV